MNSIEIFFCRSDWQT